MSLIKPAEGLGKFTLTCGFWRSLKWSGRSVAAIGLQAAGVSYSYEHMTDGKLPRHVEDLAVALGLRVSQVRKPLKELLGAGIWAEADDHLVICDFFEHNPSRDEVRASRQKRADASAKANHARWHKSTSDPDCPLCSRPDSDGESETDSESDRKRNGPRTPYVRNGRNGEDVEGKETPPSPPDDGFDAFWKLYPPRNGKKVEKVKAARIWNRMPKSKRTLAFDAVGHYAQACNSGITLAKDACRWLSGECWNDWQTPAASEAGGPELCEHGVPAGKCIPCRRESEAS